MTLEAAIGRHRARTAGLPAVGKTSASKPMARIGALPVALQSAASLMWIPQAALLALAVGGIAAGEGAAAAIAPALGILLIGAARAMAE
ncbi:thiol reductant ABC exporter subunit CydD, partial [Nitratireductor sp. ZSWI3]|nr:thiol reductant ABC exporter subunit CydD [Nitratireductor sp. ZSWI3]